MNISRLSIIIFLIPFVTTAQYYESDYPSGYAPNNFGDALENIDYSGCSNILEEFDDAFRIIEEAFNTTGWTAWPSAYNFDIFNINKGVIPYNGHNYSTAGQLKDAAQEDIRLCIIDAREWFEDQEKIAAENKRKEAAKLFELEQQAKLQKAIEECDLEYLENLSNKEKMATYDERTACKSKLAEASLTSETPKETKNLTPTYISEPPTYITPPRTYVEPVYVNETNTDRTENNTILEATSTPTTTVEKIELSEEELNRIVEERVAEALNQTETESEPPKPSIFRRVINFFKSIFQ